MRSSEEMKLSPGEILYSEGDTNDSGFIIESGEVILYSTVDGKRVNRERRGAGSIIGELSILTGQPRTVTVEALEPCRIFKICAAQILDRFEKLDPILRACIDTSINFSARLNETDTPKPGPVPLAPSTLRNSGELIERLSIEADIVKGLDADEFQMVYQPIVRMTDGTLAGVEALMRWTHPVMGNIPPGRFVPVAEESGLVNELTKFALCEACAALRRIKAVRHPGTDFFMSVNVSGDDLASDKLVDFLAFLLDQNDMDPGSLKLEVTETALISDAAEAVGNLRRLRDLGCHISVDDFGTGYSNFAYLNAMPLSTLKIDRAFVEKVHEKPSSRGIVRMLVSLGQELGIDVIAEGIEEREELDLLVELGCIYGQGYYLSKPKPEAEILSMAADRQIADRYGT